MCTPKTTARANGASNANVTISNVAFTIFVTDAIVFIASTLKHARLQPNTKQLEFTFPSRYCPNATTSRVHSSSCPPLVYCYIRRVPSV